MADVEPIKLSEPTKLFEPILISGSDITPTLVGNDPIKQGTTCYPYFPLQSKHLDKMSRTKDSDKMIKYGLTNKAQIIRLKSLEPFLESYSLAFISGSFQSHQSSNSGDSSSFFKAIYHGIEHYGAMSMKIIDHDKLSWKPWPTIARHIFFKGITTSQILNNLESEIRAAIIEKKFRYDGTKDGLLPILVDKKVRTELRMTIVNATIDLLSGLFPILSRSSERPPEMVAAASFKLWVNYITTQRGGKYPKSHPFLQSVLPSSGSTDPTTEFDEIMATVQTRLKSQKHEAENIGLGIRFLTKAYEALLLKSINVGNSEPSLFDLVLILPYLVSIHNVNIRVLVTHPLVDLFPQSLHSKESGVGKSPYYLNPVLYAKTIFDSKTTKPKMAPIGSIILVYNREVESYGVIIPVSTVLPSNRIYLFENLSYGIPNADSKRKVVNITSSTLDKHGSIIPTSRWIKTCTLMRYIKWILSKDMYKYSTSKFVVDSINGMNVGQISPNDDTTVLVDVDETNTEPVKIPLQQILKFLDIYYNDTTYMKELIHDPNSFQGIGFNVYDTNTGTIGFIGEFKHSKTIVNKKPGLCKDIHVFKFRIEDILEVISKDDIQKSNYVGHVGSQLLSHGALFTARLSHPLYGYHPFDLSQFGPSTNPMVTNYSYHSRLLLMKQNLGQPKIISSQSPNDLEDIHFPMSEINPTGMKYQVATELVLIYYGNIFTNSRTPLNDYDVVALLKDLLD